MDMGTQYEESTAWAKTLTDEQLSFALYELRARGNAVAAYEASDASELFDLAKEPDDAEWFDKDALEDAMCEAARDTMRSWLQDAGAFDEPPAEPSRAPATA